MIASRDNNRPSTTKPTPRDAVATNVMVDNTTMKMIKYINGSNWKVNYFSQATGAGDVQTQFDQNTPVAEQHYIKIHNLEVTLTSPITTTNIGDLSGEATVNLIEPQVGDLMTAPLISGDNAIFRVNEVVPLNYALDVVYKITFSLDTTDIIDPVRFDDLENSVVKVLHYNKDSIFTESDAILTTDNMELTNRLSRYIYDLTMDYQDMFIDSLIYLKKESGDVYSPIIEELAIDIMDFKDLDYTPRVNKRSRFIESFISYRTFRKEYFIKINKNSSNDFTIRMRMLLPSNIKEVISCSREKEEYNLPTFNDWLYDGDNVDNPYFLYDPDSSSKLSRLIKEYLVDGLITNDDAMEIMDHNSLTLTSEEFYYFGPLLVMLAKYKMKTLYSK